MARPKRPAPVLKVDLEDHGQDFLTWYVRNRIVIDCEPCQARIWIGTHIARLPVVGEKLRIMNRHQRKYVELNYPVEAVTQLNDEQAGEVIARYRDTMKEIVNNE